MTRKRPSPDGVLVIDKPRGPTSHDVVMKIRKSLHTRAVGHCGTLDPMATGVLVVTVGEATKLVPYLTSDDKAYRATILLGRTTDTLDAEGTQTSANEVAQDVRDALSARRWGEGTLNTAIRFERARTSQIPPIFSAIRIDGERAHERARRGEWVDMPARRIEVRALAITGSGLEPEPWLEVEVDAAKGYFVRALARDLAEALGTVGHLVVLRRTRSGTFTLEQATPLESDLDAALLSIRDAATRALPITRLTADGARAAGFGQSVRGEDLEGHHAGPSAWLDPAGQLVAVGETTADGLGRVLRGFVSNQPGPR